MGCCGRDDGCSRCGSVTWHRSQEECDKEAAAEKARKEAHERLERDAKSFLRAYGIDTHSNGYVNTRLYERLMELRRDGILLACPPMVHLSKDKKVTLCGMEIGAPGAPADHVIEEGRDQNHKTGCQACYDKSPAYDPWDYW